MYLNGKFVNNTNKYMKKSIVQKMLPLFYLLIIVISVGLYYFYNNNLKKEFISVTGLTTDINELVLNYGQTATIPVKIEPENATFKGLMWKSSNPSLISVDSLGNITVLKNEIGESLITVKTNESGYEICIKVKVIKKEYVVNVTNINIINENIELKYGETTKINANIEPENATNKNISWESSNPDVVSVDKNGNIKVISNIDSEVIITAKSLEGNFTDSIIIKTKKEITISDIKVKGIKINSKETTLTHNSKYKIDVELIPSNATNKNISWKSSNPSLVNVDKSGNITVLKNEEGKATIKVKSEDGEFTDSIVIKVKKVNTNENSNINPENKPNTNPSNNPDTSPNTNQDNKPNINPEPPKQENIKVTGIKLDKNNLVLKYGEQIKVEANVIPTNATNKNISWTSSDNSLVSVDAQGNIISKSGKIGIATITAKTKDGGYSKKVDIKIVPSGNSVSFKGGSNYTKYKTNILLRRTDAVMQNFTIHGNNLYISQGQSTTSKGAYLTKINMSEVKNETGSGQYFEQAPAAIIENYGHGDVIDIETTNGVNYLWTRCYLNNTPAYFCRIKFNDIKFGNPSLLNSNLNTTLKISGKIISPGINMVAVDSVNRTIVFLSGGTGTHIYTVYNLDDFLKNQAKASTISTFTINHSKSGISRQGIDVSGNYIYSYEGNSTEYDTNEHIVYLSIYSLTGEKIVYRKQINYPSDNYYWEPEGIKIHNDKIYIGFGRIEKDKSKKTAYIYTLN